MKYNVIIDPKTIGDFELEWLSPEEQEKRWESVREAIRNDEQPYEIEVDIEEDPLLDGEREDDSFTSHRMIIWDASKY